MLCCHKGQASAWSKEVPEGNFQHLALLLTVTLGYY